HVFSFADAASTHTHPLSLHDALPISYTTPREAYARLIPLFIERWRRETGEEISFEESYLGSGAQSRAVCEGFEADIVALSLDPEDRKSTRLNSSHVAISYAVFCLKKK